MTTDRPGSLTILRVAFGAIRLHPRLLLFPLISAALSMVLMGLAAAFSIVLPGEVAGADLGCVLSMFSDPSATETSIRIRAGIASTLFVGYGVGLVAMICSVGLSRAAMGAMADMRAPIDAFFEAVKINADNQTVRRYRLNLLSRIRTICLSVADLTRIEG